MVDMTVWMLLLLNTIWEGFKLNRETLFESFIFY